MTDGTTLFVKYMKAIDGCDGYNKVQHVYMPSHKEA